jgi:biotin transport system substrate-specific component
MSVATVSVLADAWGRPARRSTAWVRDAALVAGFVALTAVGAQVRIALPFTPVPITGQTFAVLLAGAVLGAGRGAASQAAYWIVGMVGVPVYADAQAGWAVATGPTMGYLAGFVVAAWLVGRLAERRHDRRFVTAAPAMLLGTAAIYACGVAWLAVSLGVPILGGTPDAVELGLTPFLAGDAIKLLLAAAATSGTWRLIGAAHDAR